MAFSPPGGVPELAGALRSIVRDVLERAWASGEHGDMSYAYTQPSPTRYPWQWYRDSCLNALLWRRFDPERSRAELESLLAVARPDGFIGHTIFWGSPVRFPRTLFYDVVTPDDLMTSAIQPPSVAWAWRVAVGDPAAVPAIMRHHDWFERERDLEGDGLIWILQPDESGLDASPQFDPVWRWRAQGLPGFVPLVRHNRRLGFDIGKVRAAGGPVVCEVFTNVLQGLARLALGRPSITPALVDRLYDERAGVFRLTAEPPVERRIPLTWTTLAPLALPDLPEAIGRRLVEEHLSDPRRFQTPYGPPSVAAGDPSFTRRDTFLGLRRYWRGPTWFDAVWLVWQGLARLGYGELADAIARPLAEAAVREGLREYYDPFTGAGMGAVDFAPAGLILEMADPDGVRALTEPRRAAGATGKDGG